jgi:hypothetical protein
MICETNDAPTKNSTNTQINSIMTMRPTKKKNNRKPKLNITLREETKQKLAALAELEKRSVSNFIEIMTDKRWDELAERQGVDWAKTCRRYRWLKRLKREKVIAKYSDARPLTEF